MYILITRPHNYIQVAGLQVYIQWFIFTGLDPAYPRFSDNNLARGLHRSHADLVDVIHTDGEGLTHLGLRDPIGHLDYYPNGGSFQPGCHSLGPKTRRDIHNQGKYIIYPFLLLGHEKKCSIVLVYDEFRN